MRNATLAIPAALALCALGLSAADVWNKDYKEWTNDDVQKILTDSPWAKKATATMQSEGNGSGYPGSQGGSGYPGSGGMGRGGGIGGMGGGFPGGGGMGGMGGGGGRRRGGSQNPVEKENVIVRWDSAMTVKEALLKQQYGSHLPSPGDPSYTLDKPGKDYIISVSGLRMSSRRRYSDDDSSDGSRDSGSRDSDNRDSNDTSADRMRSTLLASTQLMTKGKSTLDPDDVKITLQSDGTSTAQFFFPRSPELNLDDKEVTFLTQTGRMKIETKFKLKEMVSNGKLALY